MSRSPAPVFGALLLSILISAPGLAETSDTNPAGRLNEVERALEQSRDRQQSLTEQTTALEREAAELRRQRIAGAAKVQELEVALGRVEGQIEALAEEERAKAEALARGRGQTGRVLMALERLARFPPEALISQPASPNDTVRSAILLRSAVPRLEEQAFGLRRELASLEATRRELAARSRELAQGAATLNTERLRLAALIEKNSAAKGETAAARRLAERAMQDLARQAKDIRELVDQIESARKKREEQGRLTAKAAVSKATPPPLSAAPGGSIGTARGGLALPVAGSIVGQYGEPTDTGLTRKGIDVQTRAGAQVVAPYDGVVVYAGEFRGYGQLLIIEHSEGYHSLLAGMARIDVALGQRLAAGEPVALMGEPVGGKAALYVELRRNGQPINPLPWLAARKS